EDGIRDFHVTGVQTCALPIFELDGDHPPQTVEDATGAGDLVAGHGGRAQYQLRSGLVGEDAAVDVVWPLTRRVGGEDRMERELRSEERRVGKEGSGQRPLVQV